MNQRTLVLALALLFAAAAGTAQCISSPPASQSRLSAVTGVWRGQMDGLPAVTFVITDESGSLSGAALFYLHMRKTVKDPYTSTPGLPEPLFHPQFDGKTLTFQISHRRAHPPGSLSDPPVTLTLTLIGPNRAKLANKSETAGPSVVMVRSDY